MLPRHQFEPTIYHAHHYTTDQLTWKRLYKNKTEVGIWYYSVLKHQILLNPNHLTERVWYICMSGRFWCYSDDILPFWFKTASSFIAFIFTLIWFITSYLSFNVRLLQKTMKIKCPKWLIDIKILVWPVCEKFEKFANRTILLIYHVNKPCIISDLRHVVSSRFLSSTNKTDCHDITEILLTVALNIITLTV